MHRDGDGKSGMRHLAFALALLTTAGVAARAAELDIPPARAPENISIQQGPPNCSRWTDECVNCTRGADGEAPICSNIGFGCQPKAIRCVGSGTSSKQ